MTSRVEVPPLTGLIHFFSSSLRVNVKMALASSDLLCSGRTLNALLFLSPIYVTGSNTVTHGQLFCKEINDVNIRT